MEDQPQLIDVIKSKLLTWISGVISLATAIIGFVLLLQGNYPLGITVLGILAVVTLLLSFVYVTFARTPPLVEGGKGVYRFEKYRPWALMGIGFVVGLACTIFFCESSRSFVKTAFIGTPTPTSTVAPSSTSEPTPSSTSVSTPPPTTEIYTSTGASFPSDTFTPEPTNTLISSSTLAQTPTIVPTDKPSPTYAQQITETPITTLTPSITRTGQIVYYIAQYRAGEIYIVNADGSDQMRLTDNPADDSYPHWSPDGTKIVFQSDRDDNCEIYVMNADGTQQTNVTNRSGDDLYPQWAPDGTRIYFCGRAVAQPPYVMNPDGSDRIKLASDYLHCHGYTFSPDGTQIADILCREQKAELYVMNTDGSNAIRLKDDLGNCNYSPMWSPDGTQIAFFANIDGKDDIYIIDVDGTSEFRLTNNSTTEKSYTWSPDGKWMALYFERDGNTDIYLISIDGSSLIQLTTDPAKDHSPKWSPDGTQIAFIRETSSQDRHIYVVNIDGTGETRLTDRSINYGSFSWQP